ncbi:MAG: lipoyl(octanoyl) transferase LipB [Dehalococcoidia bacterium]
MKQFLLSSNDVTRPGHVINLGKVDYQEALDLQVSLREQRIAGEVPDTLVLLEHPPVITIGRSGSLDNVLAPERELEAHGIRLLHTNRGGDVTYHGPGQLVGYTIMDLRPYGMNLQEHLRRLEEATIQALEVLGIRAGHNQAGTGVWVGEEKIASIGLHIRRWVTMHGFALNLHPNLGHFSLIYPCGIKDRAMTSVERLLGHRVDSSQARSAVARGFGNVFGLCLEERQPPPGMEASWQAVSRI